MAVYRHSRLIFTSRISTLPQFSRARAIDEYDVTIPMPHDWVTSQVNVRYAVVTSQCYFRKDSPWWQWQNERSMTVFVVCFVVFSCVQNIKKRARNITIYGWPLITVFWSLLKRFANNFHSWFHHSWKSSSNLTFDQQPLATPASRLPYK